MADTPILETRGITVRFGGHVAVKDVSITVGRGTVTGLIGPNGAGKTTLFNTITGLQKPTAGKVFLDGRDVTTLPPYKRAERGSRAPSSVSSCSCRCRCGTTCGWPATSTMRTRAGGST